ncbi:hypothetical protein [Methylobacterium sp. WSM2598]|uniref:hypothetical protein n=1 Tax=Methylobacterium sp. WSM2598 TaxID=398261 RepID=UPI0003A13101|nr:hypothetical protein [Methylobacterium sp. WSM2598]
MAAKHDMPMWRGYGLISCGWAAAQEGQPDEGLELVRQGCAELDALGAVFHRTRHLAVLAEIQGSLGDPVGGLQVLKAAYDEVQRTEVRLFEADLHHVEGELRFRAGEPNAEVERCFARGLEIARRQGAKSAELRLAMGLLRVQQREGCQDESHELLAELVSWFREGLDTVDLGDARMLLERQGPSR